MGDVAPLFGHPREDAEGFSAFFLSKRSRSCRSLLSIRVPTSEGIPEKWSYRLRFFGGITTDFSNSG